MGSLPEKKSEEHFCLTTCILRRTTNVVSAKDIKAVLTSRMDAWEAGKYDMLVQATLRDLKARLSSKQGTTTPDDRARVFQQKVLLGDIKGAVT